MRLTNTDTKELRRILGNLENAEKSYISSVLRRAVIDAYMDLTSFIIDHGWKKP